MLIIRRYCSNVFLICTKINNYQLYHKNLNLSFLSIRLQHNAAANSRGVMAKRKSYLDPMALFLFLIPVTTFGLGTWQVKRRQWKLDLIASLQQRTSSSPKELPEDLSELNELEYYPVRVRGHFDHTKELILGPRSLIVEGDASSQGGLLSKSGGNQSGCNVITPFHLSDRDLTILINRGWVPQKYKNPDSRKEGQVKDEVEIVGILRLNENRAPFMPDNQANQWFYRDVNKMAQLCNCEPIYLEAIADSTVPGGPVGGQTRVSLRNEHLSYVFTWYSLSLGTAIMWYRNFVQRARFPL